MGERRKTLPAAINQEQNDEGEKSKLTRLHKDSQAKLSRKRRALKTLGARKRGLQPYHSGKWEIFEAEGVADRVRAMGEGNAVGSRSRRSLRV